jgi:hypothetical protein
MRSVQRWCKSRGIGKRVGRDVLLTAADVKKLATLIRTGPGRPPHSPPK